MDATSSTASSSPAPATRTKASGASGQMQALVLAGGEGTRLRPLTLTTPQPVMPLAGRPFLSYMLHWLARHRVDDALLALGYKADAVHRVLGDQHHRMRLRHLVEDEPPRTAQP